YTPHGGCGRTSRASRSEGRCNRRTERQPIGISNHQPTMKRHSLRTLLTAAAGLPFVLAGSLPAQSAPSNSTTADTAGETIELSPFVVSSDTDTGWVASNSLAGSRLNTPLRDTGASISVLTSEFIQDLGAIDVSEAV